MNRLFSFYKTLFSNDKLNIPALFFMGLGIFGLIALFTSFISDFMLFPFAIVATLASFFAMWYLNILGSLREQVDKLETTVESLKESNDTLHDELLALESLRENLELYASENQKDFSKVLNDINGSFQRLEIIAKENEKTLIARVAQDLEFLDSKVGMKRDEYERFVNRIPNNLKQRFHELGYASFDNVAGNNHIVDYKEIKNIVQSVVA
jgi:ABC-type multidrug transport system fused ATPase/permease subunit